MNKEIQIPSENNIFDLKTAGHSLLPNAPTINKHPTTIPLCITLPDGPAIAYTHICLLDIPQLPVSAQIAHIMPDLAHSSLISIKNFGDAV